MITLEPKDVERAVWEQSALMQRLGLLILALALKHKPKVIHAAQRGRMPAAKFEPRRKYACLWICPGWYLKPYVAEFRMNLYAKFKSSSSFSANSPRLAPTL
jgi:hypothetical protein